jgi:hypothetical protein
MSLYEKQKAENPKIEDIARDLIGGNDLSNLLGFLGFLKENKLTPRIQSTNSWTVKYKGKTVCHIKIDYSVWRIMLNIVAREKWFNGNEKYFAEDELKEFVWDNVKDSWCPRGCKGTITVLGKEFNEVCVCWAIRIDSWMARHWNVQKR